MYNFMCKFLCNFMHKFMYHFKSKFMYMCIFKLYGKWALDPAQARGLIGSYALVPILAGPLSAVLAQLPLKPCAWAGIQTHP